MISVYTDGSCKKNGLGGWSFVHVLHDRALGVARGTEEQTTNQRMELLAALKGIEAVPALTSLEVVSDSAYLVNCFLQRWYVAWEGNRNWSGVKNRDLWEDLLTAVRRRRAATTFRHVRGHNGDRWNEIADQLANPRIDLSSNVKGLPFVL